LPLPPEPPAEALLVAFDAPADAGEETEAVLLIAPWALLVWARARVARVRVRKVVSCILTLLW
jgi:hypothetical protein